VNTNFYEKIKEVSEVLYYKALTVIPIDVVEKIKRAYNLEESLLGKRILDIILRNIDIARKRNLLVCQDTELQFI